MKRRERSVMIGCRVPVSLIEVLDRHAVDETRSQIVRRLIRAEVARLTKPEEEKKER